MLEVELVLELELELELELVPDPGVGGVGAAVQPLAAHAVVVAATEPPAEVPV